MPNSLTYGQLNRLLRALGFEYIFVPDSHEGYIHQESNTTIMLAIHSHEEPARLADIRHVRRMVDERGLLDGRDFDQMVAKGRIPRSLPRRATAD